MKKQVKIKISKEKHTFLVPVQASCMLYVPLCCFCSTVQWGRWVAVRKSHFFIGVQNENQPAILENHQHQDIPNDTISPCKEPRVFAV